MSVIVDYNYSTLTTLQFEVDEPIDTLYPELEPDQTGSTLVYSVSPPLPEGISINTSTGVISGTPTTVSALTAYTFTVTNTSDTPNNSFQLILYIEVYDACLPLACGCDQGYFNNLVVGVQEVKDYLSDENGEIFSIENYTGSSYQQVTGELLELN